MLLNLIATVTAGIGAAGLVMIANHILKGRLPKWLIPVAAGLTMIGVQISSEYSWFETTRSKFAEGVVVVSKVEETIFYRPWSYIFPQTTRFLALDLATKKTNPAHPDMVLVDLFAFQRNAPTHKIAQLVDCTKMQRADIIEGVDISNEGEFTGLQWIALEKDNPIITNLCGGA